MSKWLFKVEAYDADGARAKGYDHVLQGMEYSDFKIDAAKNGIDAFAMTRKLRDYEEGPVFFVATYMEVEDHEDPVFYLWLQTDEDGFYGHVRGNGHLTLQRKSKAVREQLRDVREDSDAE